jgi:hypothetical protein
MGAAMMALVPLTILVGCGSGSSTVSTEPSAAASPGADVAVLGCQGSLKVEPSEVVACSIDEPVKIDHVDWTGWGEDPAYGRGRAIINTCEPYCAAGNYHLFRVILIATGLKPCQESQVYSAIRFAVISEGTTPSPGPGKLNPPPSHYCD